MKKILVVVGTRPNFIKISQFRKSAQQYNFDLKIVHTGQHYDDNLSSIFFQQLDIEPDYFLDAEESDVNTQSEIIKTKLLHLFKQVFLPDLVIVVGDVNSTRIAAEATSETGIKIAHVESGLRSFDLTMPEEINRIKTDDLSNYFFVTEQSGVDNLLTEGKKNNHIFFVGNTMIDTLINFNEQINNNNILSELKIEENKFALLTFHRPGNVDSKENLDKIISLLRSIQEHTTCVFPLHPRTEQKLMQYDLLQSLQELNNLILLEPLGYFPFQKLISTCAYIITDSGGIQEESTFRKKPCITIRPNTERPSTITLGTNTLTDWDENHIHQLISIIENKTYKSGTIPPLWDGESSQRIFQILSDCL